MIEELHKRGYENLKTIPSLSPSGVSWHLEFLNLDKKETCWHLIGYKVILE